MRVLLHLQNFSSWMAFASMANLTILHDLHMHKYDKTQNVDAYAG